MEQEDHFLPWTHQGNDYLYTTNSVNNLKTGRTDLPKLVVGKSSHGKG